MANSDLEFDVVSMFTITIKNNKVAVNNTILFYFFSYASGSPFGENIRKRRRAMKLFLLNTQPKLTRSLGTIVSITGSNIFSISQRILMWYVILAASLLNRLIWLKDKG